MIKNILFDFDGVILDSMPTREYGFREVFKKFDDDLVERLLEFHNINGGLSRYVKIRYFYEELLKQKISDEEIKKIADKFSIIMKKELIDKKYLIKETLNFLEDKGSKYNLHIVSGSDEIELRYLCEELDVAKYFHSIHGSPTHKNDLVKNVLKEYRYTLEETILIGDSINDYEASKINGIEFYGYNNEELKKVSYIYLDSYEDVKN